MLENAPVIASSKAIRPQLPMEQKLHKYLLRIKKTNHTSGRWYFRMQAIIKRW
jgi:hypothetical protein